MSDAQILQCLECSGKFRGDETCAELKALNDIALQIEPDDNVTAQEENNVVNWHESFCETYNICVETNCPKQCQREQDAWAECLVIELDCDWRCPGLSMKGSRTVGMYTMSSGSIGLSSTRRMYNGIIALGISLILVVL